VCQNRRGVEQSGSSSGS